MIKITLPQSLASQGDKRGLSHAETFRL